MSPVPEDPEHLRTAVRDRYTRAAQTRGKCTPTQSTWCGSNSSCCRTESDLGTSDLYSQEELAGLPQGAVQLSLGCGNPTALAELKPGEHVLDLGSGGGIDVLLSARRVGPDGFVYGLDMTDAMLEEAERNRAQAGVENVQFLKGIMEAIPLCRIPELVSLVPSLVSLATLFPRTSNPIFLRLLSFRSNVILL